MTRTRFPKEGVECYACDAPAITSEHAPPKGFYPKRQDNIIDHPKIDLRTNLIEVPSCFEHNNSKSKSDGYTRTIIALVARALADTPGPHSPFLRKMIDTAHRGPRLRETMKNTTDFPHLGMTGIHPDMDAYHETMEATARALYFHEHEWEERWPGSCHIISPHFRYADLSAPPNLPSIEFALSRFDSPRNRDALGIRRKGPHQSVFFYQLLETDHIVCMRMSFYGAFDVLACAWGQI